jgi:hypothetical protein
MKWRHVILCLIASLVFLVAGFVLETDEMAYDIALKGVGILFAVIALVFAERIVAARRRKPPT